MKISKTTYIIIICLFIGAFGSYMYKHYIKKQPAPEVHKVEYYATNPVNPETGIPNKAKISNPNGALVYNSDTASKPYGMINKGTIITLNKKAGNNRYEITYSNETLYISPSDLSYDVQ